jgi:diadenosine tetraphosphate (Ap4A) HIT family hydrolase
VKNTLEGKCPFCQIDHNYNKIIFETEAWNVFPCNPPEKYTKYHIIFAPKKHLKSVDELDDVAVLELFSLIKKVKVKFNIVSGGIQIRDGDATLSAGTIPHLHVHLMVPDGTGRLESPFYKGAASEAEGLARALVYEKLRTGMPIENLIKEEQALIMDRV